MASATKRALGGRSAGSLRKQARTRGSKTAGIPRAASTALGGGKVCRPMRRRMLPRSLSSKGARPESTS